MDGFVFSLPKAGYVQNHDCQQHKIIRVDHPCWVRVKLVWGFCNCIISLRALLTYVNCHSFQMEAFVKFYWPSHMYPYSSWQLPGIHCFLGEK